MIALKKICAREVVDLEKHSEVRPQGGHVYNYKALQRVGGEPPVFQIHYRPEAYFFSLKINFFLEIKKKSFIIIITLNILGIF